MTKKNLITLLVVFAVLGLAAWMLGKGRRGKVNKTVAVEVGKNLFPDFPINEATNVSIKTFKDEVSLEKKGDKWGVKERDGYAANFSNISDLMQKLWETRVVQVYETGPSQLGRMKLAQPGEKDAKEDEVGTRIVVKKDDKELASLTLGKDIEGKSEGDSPFGMDFKSTVGKYVKVGGKDGVVFGIKETFSSVNTTVGDWLDKTFIAPSGPIKLLEVKTDPADQGWKVSRDKDTADPVFGEPSMADLDADKVKQAGTASMPSSFNDVAVAAAETPAPEPTKPAENETEEQKKAREAKDAEAKAKWEADKDKTGMASTKRAATVEYFDGFTYNFKVGKQTKPDDTNSDYYVSFTVAFTQPPEPTPAAEPAPPEPTPLAEPQPTKPAENETEEQKKEREKKDADAKKKWDDDKAAAKKKWEDDKAAAKKKWEEDNKNAKTKWEEDNKKKQERLTKEKALEGKTFAISKYSVEWLTRDKSYFKKAPSTPSPSTPAANSTTPTPPTVTTPSNTPKIEAVSPAIEVPGIPKPSEGKIEAVTPPVAIPPLPEESKPTDAPKSEPTKPAEPPKPVEPPKSAEPPKPAEPK